MTYQSRYGVPLSTDLIEAEDPSPLKICHLRIEGDELNIGFPMIASTQELT